MHRLLNARKATRLLPAIFLQFQSCTTDC